MSTKSEAITAMPAGLDLLRQLESDSSLPWPWIFELSEGESDILGTWTEADPSKGFLRFAITGAGSEIGFWTTPGQALAQAPVAFLDPEGEENRVLARNFDEFLVLLALGEADPTLIGTIGDDQKDNLAQARRWLEARGVKVPRAKAKSIMEKAEAANPGFQEWLEGESLESLGAVVAGPPIGRLIAAGNKEALVARLAKTRWDDPELVKAIQEVIFEDNRPGMSLLLACGMPVDLKLEYGNTPLLDAVAVGRIEIIKLLLAAGANPRAKNRHGENADILSIDLKPALRRSLVRLLDL